MLVSSECGGLFQQRGHNEWVGTSEPVIDESWSRQPGTSFTIGGKGKQNRPVHASVFFRDLLAGGKETVHVAGTVRRRTML